MKRYLGVSKVFLLSIYIYNMSLSTKVNVKLLFKEKKLGLSENKAAIQSKRKQVIYKS